MAKNLFADTNRATGETANDVEDVARDVIENLPSSKDDQQVPRNDDDGGENAFDDGEGDAHVQSSRKRALSTAAPTRTTTKRQKPMEVLAKNVGKIIEAVTKPVEIVDNDEKRMRQAMACWNREFKSESMEIKLAFVEEWQQNPRAAIQFVLLEPEDRQFLVRQKIPLRTEEGQNGRKSKDSVPDQPLDDDIDDFFEELNQD